MKATDITKPTALFLTKIVVAVVVVCAMAQCNNAHNYGTSASEECKVWLSQLFMFTLSPSPVLQKKLRSVGAKKLDQVHMENKVKFKSDSKSCTFSSHSPLELG